MARQSQKLHDETRYCANCGISFVWTVEEQRPPEEKQSSPAESNEQVVAQGETAPGATSQLPATASAAAVEPPTVCLGCRYLLPVGGRERGLVKWYHRRKGYGFITRNGADDLYVRRSALRRGHLLAGELVEFSIGQNQQGLMAADVTIVASAGG